MGVIINTDNDSRIKVATETVTATNGATTLPATYDNKKVIAVWATSYLTMVIANTSPIWKITLRDPGTYAIQSYSGSVTITVLYTD